MRVDFKRMDNGDIQASCQCVPECIAYGESKEKALHQIRIVIQKRAKKWNSILKPVDYEECPRGGGDKCRCEVCIFCGNRKHTAVHGGVLDDDTKGIVWDHFFCSPITDNKART